MKTKTIKDLKFETLLPKELIKKRVNEIALQLDALHIGSEPPLMICVMNGAFIFTADLVRAMQVKVLLGFIRASSYRGTTSSGNLELSGIEKLNIEGKNIVIVEDIIDTGATLEAIIEQLQKQNPLQLHIVSLLQKPHAPKFENTIVGFEIDDRFVVGYGLDYDGLGRDIDEIMVVK